LGEGGPGKIGAKKLATTEKKVFQKSMARPAYTGRKAEGREAGLSFFTPCTRTKIFKARETDIWAHFCLRPVPSQTRAAPGPGSDARNFGGDIQKDTGFPRAVAGGAEKWRALTGSAGGTYRTRSQNQTSLNPERGPNRQNPYKGETAWGICLEEFAGSGFLMTGQRFGLCGRLRRSFPKPIFRRNSTPTVRAKKRPPGKRSLRGGGVGVSVGQNPDVVGPGWEPRGTYFEGIPPFTEPFLKFGGPCGW